MTSCKAVGAETQVGLTQLEGHKVLGSNYAKGGYVQTQKSHVKSDKKIAVFNFEWFFTKPAEIFLHQSFVGIIHFGG